MARQWWEEENPKSDMYDVYSSESDSSNTNRIPTKPMNEEIYTDDTPTGYAGELDEVGRVESSGGNRVVRIMQPKGRVPSRPSDEDLNIFDAWKKFEPEAKKMIGVDPEAEYKKGFQEWDSNFNNTDLALFTPEKKMKFKQDRERYAGSRRSAAEKEASQQMTAMRGMFTKQWEVKQKEKETAAKAKLERGGIDAIGKIGTTPPGEKNEAALEGLNEGQSAVVKKLTNYEIDLPSGMALRTPYWQAILERASLYDTSFSAEQYKTRLALKKDFTSGNGAKNIRSLNTAVQHLDTLTKAMKELDNAPVQFWNTVTNYGLTKVGDPRVTKFNTAATALSGELANVFKNTSGTDQEIKEWRKNLNTSDSPEQLLANINTVIELLGGRVGALQNQWEKGLGKPKDFNFLSNKSRDILKAIGVDTDKLDPISGQSMEKAPAQAEKQTGIITYYDNGKRYNIPSDKESAFLKARPNAKRGK